MPRRLNMSGLLRNRLLTNSGAYLFGTVLNRIFPLFLLPLYTRVMSPHEFGVWGFCFTMLQAVLILTELGLDDALTRLYYDKQKERLDEYLFAAFVTRIGTALVSGAGLLAGMLLIWPLLTGDAFLSYPFAPLLVGVAIAQSLVSFDLARARAARNPAAFIKVQVSQSVLQAALSAVLVGLLGLGAAGPFYAHLAAAIVVGLFVSRRYLRRADGSALHWPVVRESLNFGIRTTPNRISNWLQKLADRVVIGRTASMQQLGIYQLAASAIAPLYIVMSSINSAYLPFYYERRKKGAESLPLIAAVDMVIVTALAALVIGAISIVPELIRVLAPPSYAGAVIVSPLLVLAAFFASITLQFNKELLFHKRPGLASAITTIPSLAAVLVNIWLVPKWGIMVAAWVSFADSVIILVASIVITRRVEKTGHSVPRIAAACTVVFLYALASMYRLPTRPFEVTDIAIRIGSGLVAILLVAALLLPRALPFLLKARGRAPDAPLAASA